MAALTASTFGYLAYAFSKSSFPIDVFRSRIYASAAITILGIIPYTLLVMKGPTAVNDKLIAKVENLSGFDVIEKVTEAGLSKGETTKELLSNWATHNAVRGLFLLPQLFWVPGLLWRKLIRILARRTYERKGASRSETWPRASSAHLSKWHNRKASVIVDTPKHLGFMPVGIHSTLLNSPNTCILLFRQHPKNKPEPSSCVLDRYEVSGVSSPQ